MRSGSSAPVAEARTWSIVSSVVVIPVAFLWSASFWNDGASRADVMMSRLLAGLGDV
jgi:hypothetical protein